MRIVVATALALLIAVPLDLAIEAAARQAFSVSPEFEPFQGTVAPYTAGGIVLAAATYAVVRRYARDPATIFVALAAVALVASWLPDIALLALSDPGATVPAVGSLMLMHLATALIVTTALVRIAPKSAASR